MSERYKYDDILTFLMVYVSGSQSLLQKGANVGCGILIESGEKIIIISSRDQAAYRFPSVSSLTLGMIYRGVQGNSTLYLTFLFIVKHLLMPSFKGLIMLIWGQKIDTQNQKRVKRFYQSLDVNINKRERRRRNAMQLITFLKIFS